ncbi:MAG: RNA 2',3'-cyclic phosphodiesterase [Candidatus Diapherotrites archaeon]
MNKRVFIVINLPEETKKEVCDSISCKIDGKKCKVVEEENLHVTMLFLGYLNEEAVKELEEKLSAIKELSAFNAVLEGAGHFNGRVIWLGVKEGKKEIEAIYRKLSELIGVEDERFSAHVTLARVKGMKRSEVEELVKELNQGMKCQKIPITSVDLMESVLSPKGPKYFVIKRFELKK